MRLHFHGAGTVRRLLWGVGLTLLALLLVMIGLGTLLGTTSGSRWLLAQVPGLNVEAFEGRLGQRWQAERRSGRRARIASRYNNRVWPVTACLLKRTLCIEELVIGDIELSFAPSEPDPNAEPFSLPELKLPLALQVERIEIGRLTLNESEQLRRLHVQADWRADGLDIHRLELRRDDLDRCSTAVCSPVVHGRCSCKGRPHCARRTSSRGPCRLPSRVICASRCGSRSKVRVTSTAC